MSQGGGQAERAGTAQVIPVGSGLLALGLLRSEQEAIQQRSPAEPVALCPPGARVLPGQQGRPTLDHAHWSQGAPLALGHGRARRELGRGLPRKQVSVLRGEGQGLSRESHLCINSVNFQLPGKALSRERGFSKFALAFPETSLEDSSASSLKAEKVPFLLIVAGKELTP